MHATARTRRATTLGLAGLSALLLALHRRAALGAGGFEKDALAALRRHVSFDAALWASGSLGAAGPQPHTLYLCGLPPRMMQEWEAIKNEDLLFARALRAMGKVVCADARRLADGTPLPPAVAAHCRRWRMERVAACVYPLPEVGLLSALSLYRRDPRNPFSAAECGFIEAAIAHLADGLNRHRLGRVRERRQETHALALCDRKGILHAAAETLTGLMRCEWPDWRGPHLPPALLGAKGEFKGRHLVARCAAAEDDLIWVAVRARRPFDALSARQREVATLYASGASHRAVAARLGLSPETVRNHLKRVYRVLGVGDKAALAQQLARI